jgi:hypothetical protein
VAPVSWGAALAGGAVGAVAGDALAVLHGVVLGAACVGTAAVLLFSHRLPPVKDFAAKLAAAGLLVWDFIPPLWVPGSSAWAVGMVLMCIPDDWWGGGRRRLAAAVLKVRRHLARGVPARRPVPA